jgi:hypothetical protein
MGSSSVAYKRGKAEARGSCRWRWHERGGKQGRRRRLLEEDGWWGGVRCHRWVGSTSAWHLPALGAAEQSRARKRKDGGGQSWRGADAAMLLPEQSWTGLPNRGDHVAAACARHHVKLTRHGGSCTWHRAQWQTAPAHAHMHTWRGMWLPGRGLSARCSTWASRRSGGIAGGGWMGWTGQLSLGS